MNRLLSELEISTFLFQFFLAEILSHYVVNVLDLEISDEMVVPMLLLSNGVSVFNGKEGNLTVFPDPVFTEVNITSL